MRLQKCLRTLTHRLEFQYRRLETSNGVIGLDTMICRVGLETRESRNRRKVISTLSPPTMTLRMRIITLLILTMTVGHTTATTATLTSTGCADSKGMGQCAAAADATSTACVSAANGDNVLVQGCGCAWYISNINCYASHCWNRVYECEYQAFASQYFESCSIAKFPIPYFPAPDGAPDSCSCNLGNILKAIQESVQEIQTCEQTQPSVGGVSGVFQKNTKCQCCGLSGAISSIYNFCPTTDPTLIGLNAISLTEKTFGLSFASCTTALDQTNCSSGLGFDATAVGGTFLTPDTLPPNGTATLTNSPGKVTAPASGTVFTYTNLADHQVYTISAVNAAPTGKSSGGSGNGSGSNGDGNGNDVGTSSKSSHAMVKISSDSIIGKVEMGVLAVMALRGILILI